jgi:hypothetical protein
MAVVESDLLGFRRGRKPRIQPLIHTQQNRILVPTVFSPLR